MKVLLFIILPTLISAQISIEIIPASDKRDASVLATGSERATAQAIDMKTFHLTEHEVINSLKQLNYLNPGKVKKELTVVLKPVTTRVIRKNQREERFQTKYYNKVSPYTFEPSINQKFVEVLRTKWYEVPDISIGRNININTSNNRFNRVSVWGQDDYENKVTKLKPSEVSISLNYMQNISCVIRTTLASIEFRVDYEISLEGKMYFENICSTYLQFFGETCSKTLELEINDFFHQLETSNGNLKMHQIINLSYYRDIEIIITDLSNDAVLCNGKLELEAS